VLSLSTPLPQSVQLPGGVTLVGFSPNVAYKLLYTLALLAAVATVRWLFRLAITHLVRGDGMHVARFWARQILDVVVVGVFIAVVFSIWLNGSRNVAAGLGLFSAGLAFALQQVISSVAGYLLILRGNVFGIGDRIDMGGVRGDVIGLGFLRTTIMEMGAPPGDTDSSEANAPSWVMARQYTGRIVTVANNAIFSDPVFNYSRDFPYLWEELHLPVKYTADHAQAEQILLDVADDHSVDVDTVKSDALDQMRRRYLMPPTDLEPAVFYQLTDN
jgi:small-conductance mechanosensitive channel